MDGWNTILSFWDFSHFQWLLLLVSGRVGTEGQGEELGNISGDSRMYPYQRTPMGNPYISPI